MGVIDHPNDKPGDNTSPGADDETVSGDVIDVAALIAEYKYLKNAIARQRQIVWTLSDLPQFRHAEDGAPLGLPYEKGAPDIAALSRTLDSDRGTIRRAIKAKPGKATARTNDTNP